MMIQSSAFSSKQSPAPANPAAAADSPHTVAPPAPPGASRYHQWSQVSTYPKAPASLSLLSSQSKTPHLKQNSRRASHGQSRNSQMRKTCEVSGGGNNFFVLDRLCGVAHVDRRRSALDERFSASIAKCLHLADEVGERQASQSRVFGSPFARRFGSLFATRKNKGKRKTKGRERFTLETMLSSK